MKKIIGILTMFFCFGMGSHVFAATDSQLVTGNVAAVNTIAIANTAAVALDKGAALSAQKLFDITINNNKNASYVLNVASANGGQFRSTSSGQGAYNAANVGTWLAYTFNLTNPSGTSMGATLPVDNVLGTAIALTVSGIDYTFTAPTKATIDYVYDGGATTVLAAQNLLLDVTFTDTITVTIAD